jgi:hypothetical protein
MGVVSFTSRPLYPQGNSPWYTLDRRLSGPQRRSGHGGGENNSQSRRDSNSDYTARSPALYQTSSTLWKSVYRAENWYVIYNVKFIEIYNFYFKHVSMRCMFNDIQSKIISDVVSGFTTISLYLQWITVRANETVKNGFGKFVNRLK